MTQQLTTIANTATGYQEMHRQIKQTSGRLFYILSVIPDPVYASGFRIREFMGRTGVKKYYPTKQHSNPRYDYDTARNTLVNITSTARIIRNAPYG